MIGASGIGKTTLTDLLTGLVPPTAGRVRVDGVPLAELDLGAWRRQVGYVPQDLPMLHDSVRRNVTLGDPSLDDAAVEAALRLAGAWEFVRALPGGLDASVGERGALVSGGQRQRISIARALVHEPRLLIFDEATAALDAESEAAVWQTIASLRGHTTVVAISHHPGLGNVADLVYRIADGRAERVDPLLRARGRRLTPMPPYTALVLAGRRGPDDPLASSRGASHRALLPVAGVPMLARVLTALRGARHVARIWISIDAPEVLESVPELAAFRDVSLHRSKESPARSVADALDELQRGARARDHRRSRAALGRARRPLPRGRRGDPGRRRGRRGRALRVRGRRRERRAHLGPAALRLVHGRQPVRVPARARARTRPRSSRAPSATARSRGGWSRRSAPRSRSSTSPARSISRARAADLAQRRREIRPVLLDDAVAAIDVDKAADLDARGEDPRRIVGRVGLWPIER